MNNRLMMLFSAEEQYKKIVEEIDKYYTQTITKTTDKEEIKKLVEFYKSVENPTLAKEFKNDFLAYFVKNTYKNLLTDKNLADLYEIAQTKEDGLESKLIITTEINNKLMVKLRSLKPEEQKEIKVAK